ncbi:hypothetical protein niasHT_034685 [Heterodera trifolii]|uniref:Uncharacterized protein n=1 Tax=Heterodera trifolii TaxID=157864 RepID=A0ABD2ISC6_9BILA
MPNIFKILFIVLLAVVSFRLSASTGGKKTANDGSGSNSSSSGIGAKIKRIVTAGLLFTSMATGGPEAIGQSNAPQGANAAAGLVPSHAPPSHAAQFEKATPVEKTSESSLNVVLAEKTPSKGTNRLVPTGSNPLHH